MTAVLRLLCSTLVLIGLLGAVPASARPAPQLKFVRFEQADGAVRWGRLIEGDIVVPISGLPWRPHAALLAQQMPLAAVRLLAPATPVNVIAIGFNYPSHTTNRPAPTEIGMFAKLPGSVIASGDPIVVPADAKNLHYEGELVIVIGRTASKVAVDRAARHVFGVMPGNDVSERDWQANDLQWLRAKASDGFGPVGPWISTGLDWNEMSVITRVNGEVKQSDRIENLYFGIPEIVSYVSQYITLLPGDLIFTGTPGTTSAIKPGDVVEVEIPGVAVLRNPVVAPE
ncbi:MAG: fumarylacetoacetate hydrolase family protein [Pseudomonadales bacterium]|jgi:2-keto-4-pentenoate hydratase/2-oxohepta-3-ene-1,7-dioic acid hydratase in catechol pathway|nr:fumarylacetoacetate hydrolase family protein [Pseudomonadales bacterium]